MPKDKRPYITVTDTMPEHPKVEPLSDAAFRLLVTTWCYCKRLQNDGRMATAAWLRRGTTKARRELEQAGLVESAGDGFVQVHDWERHQQTAAEVQQLSEKRAAAGAAGGRRKAANRLAAASNAGGNRLASAKQKASNGLANDQQISSRVEESREEELASGGAAEPPVSGKVLANASDDGPTAQTLVAEWIDHCPERPPSRVIGQVAKELQGLLNDGLPYAAVRTGLQQWQLRGLHPSVLASVVHEMRTAGSRLARPTTTPGGFDPAAALARARAAQEAAS